MLPVGVSQSQGLGLNLITETLIVFTGRQVGCSELTLTPVNPCSCLHLLLVGWRELGGAEPCARMEGTGKVTQSHPAMTGTAPMSHCSSPVSNLALGPSPSCSGHSLSREFLPNTNLTLLF